MLTSHNIILSLHKLVTNMSSRDETGWKLTTDKLMPYGPTPNKSSKILFFC